MKNYNKLKFPDLEIGQVFTTEDGSTWKVLAPINNRDTKFGLAVCLTHDNECMVGQELWFKVNSKVFLPKEITDAPDHPEDQVVISSDEHFESLRRLRGCKGFKTYIVEHFPQIDRSEILVDDTTRSYCMFNGESYRIAGWNDSTKPGKYRPIFYANLSCPYTPQLEDEEFAHQCDVETYETPEEDPETVKKAEEIVTNNLCDILLGEKVPYELHNTRSGELIWKPLRKITKTVLRNLAHSLVAGEEFQFEATDGEALNAARIMTLIRSCLLVKHHLLLGEPDTTEYSDEYFDYYEHRWIQCKKNHAFYGGAGIPVRRKIETPVFDYLEMHR